MCKTFYLILCVAAFMAFATSVAKAQPARKSVPASEVNGTFRYTFTAKKIRGASSDIKIWALGHGKLKVGFDLIYPYVVRGELSANTGEAEGEATITGDTAVYGSNEFGPCKITIKVVRPGTIKVDQDGTDADCGFGHNVMASGTYRKVSSRRPKFGLPN